MEAPVDFIAMLAEETILTIFSSLEYLDLIRCTLVNKRFERIVQDRTFKEALFRSNVTPKIVLPPNEDLLIHPALQRISWDCSNNLDSVMLLGRSGNRSTNQCVKNMQVGKEFATSPPLKELTLHVFQTQRRTVRNPKGLTVWNIMETACRAMQEMEQQQIDCFKYLHWLPKGLPYSTAAWRDWDGLSAAMVVEKKKFMKYDGLATVYMEKWMGFTHVYRMNGKLFLVASSLQTLNTLSSHAN